MDLIEKEYLPHYSESGIYRDFKNKLFELKKNAFVDLQGRGLRERIEWVFDQSNLGFPDFTDDIKGLSKSLEKSEGFRQKGNSLYANKGQLTDCLKCYNLAIAFAPPNSSNLYMAIANRSAIFITMNNVEAANSDLNLVLNSDYDYPKKLLDRKEKCLKMMNQREDKSLSQEHIDFCKDIFTLQSPNPEISAAKEDFIRIESNEEMGRHLVAQRIIHPGEVIIVEDPFAKILLDGYKFDYKHCHFCLNPVQSWIPCEMCVFAVFCSEDCRSSAQSSFHQYECKITPILHSLNLTRNMNLALRIITELGPQACHDYFKSQTSLELSNEEPYLSSDYRTIYNLISHPEKLSNSEIIEYSLISVYLIGILEKYTQFFAKFFDKGFKEFVASLILNHIQNLPCNAHSLNEMSLETGSSIKEAIMEEFGAGAFPLLSILNHSCDPNVTRFNRANGKVCVMAIKTILDGEQIFDNYGQHFAISPLQERKEFIRDHYYFDCNCEPCSKDWPLFRDLLTLDGKFRCSDCYLNKGESSNSTLSNRTDTECSLCSKKVSIKELESLCDSHETAFDEAFDQILKNEGLAAIPKLITSLKFFDLNIIPPYIYINNTQETLKQAINTLIVAFEAFNSKSK